MSTWAFGCDESGRFDRSERNLFVIGGVLLPEPRAAQTLARTLQQLCRSAGIQFPPHATVLHGAKGGDVVARLFDATVQWLSKSNGTFVAVACRPGTQGVDRAMHARMLGALIEIVGRMTAAAGAPRLTLHPASRGFPLGRTNERASAYKKAGVHAEYRDDKTDEAQWHLRGVTGGEVREAIDALRRSSEGWLPPFPMVEEIDIKSAEHRQVHPTVLAADQLCNAIYRKFREDPELCTAALSQHPDWTDERVVIVEYGLVSDVRAVDDSLRRSPPSLLAMAEASERVLVKEKHPQLGLLPAGVEGAVRLVEQFWKHSERRFVEAGAKAPSKIRAIAQRLMGDARAELDMKHGAYEATSRALRLGFFGSGPLAELVRSLPDDELRAQMYAATLQCENHRGNVHVSRQAREAFAAIYAQNCSLTLLAQALHVENLANVLEQNELPAPPEQAPAQMALVTERAEALLDFAERTNQQLGHLALRPNAAPELVSDAEKRLRRLLQDSGPVWLRRDCGHGRAYGTASRSLAFCGKLEQALQAALQSRRFFANSSQDLNVNACNLARIRAEQARLGQLTPEDELLQYLVELTGGAQMSGVNVAIRELKRNRAARFALDILLRQLRWNVAPGRKTASIPLLADAGAKNSKLFTFLTTQRSHPTELIARHIGELLLRDNHASAADRWFQLSVELTIDKGETTLGRFTPFTEALREGRAADGPPGSVLNPTFEYR